ncbi:hypothetical protein SLS59_004818 [Nothophoma quercina]|uniref:Uncharacterized protein n=1 Tax=Nothophoma quercina TaxID=749835 RepID=A0ABR3RCV9_9PLEO
MHFLRGLMNGQAKDDPSLPLPSLKKFPRNPAKPLSFWYIKSHDRRTLKEYILPYMVESLPERHLMRVILERHPWTNHLVNSQDMTALQDRVRQISASFWKDPATATLVLLQLTRMWFFSLVRYIYRIRYFEGHQTLLEDADLQDIRTQENQMYIAQLSEDVIYRLTCVQNKYETICTKLQADISKLRSTVVSQPKKPPDQLLTSLKQQIEDLDAKLTRSHAPTQAHRFTAEDLATCRWLLEHLPGGPWIQGRVGLRWGQYWQKHWTRCRLEVQRRNHPIWQLARDERFHKVGKELYATLSDRLHKYGALKGDALLPDVQRVVDAIKPVHFHDDGKVDLQAEKGRWLV